MNIDNPRFFWGVIIKGEDPMESWEKQKPKMWVSGAGWVFTSIVKKMDHLQSMTRIEALDYLHKEAPPMTAWIVPIDENPANIAWMWGVWLMGPQDFFVDGTEPAYMTDYEIMNHYKDYRISLPREKDVVEFLRL